MTESVTQPTAEPVPAPPEEFAARLRAQGTRYHNLHPFHRRMDAGELTREELQRWVANRFYYQKCIPLKDAAILANCPEVEVRREWIQRILDHDGYGDDAGGIEAWTQLALAVGLSREELEDLRHVLPAVRFAVDAYVNFARRAPWQEAMCSSLTELFAPKIHKERLSTWPDHYPWIETTGLQYFRNRLTQARRDVEQALSVTLDYFKTRAEQERALGILKFKLDILWAMNDAMALGYASKS
jgi:pyrroloquinoline-quinone synthase